MSNRIQRSGTVSKEFNTELEANNRLCTLAVAYPEHSFSRTGKTVTVKLNESTRFSKVVI